MTNGWADSTILFVSDAGAAAASYADKLGFTANWRVDEDGRTPAAGITLLAPPIFAPYHLIALDCLDMHVS